MEQSRYLNGYIYHMVHINNLPSIFRQGALLSKEMLGQKGIDPHSIAYESVQDLRERIFIWDFSLQYYCGLHNYIPFYFAVRPPMLHVQRDAGQQDALVMIKVQRAILKEKGVLFTDGNATMQQLSQNWNERVNIIPASILQGPCHRKYLPDGQPYGTNPHCSNIYCGTAFLELVDWDLITGRRFEDDKAEYKRLKSAEVLIPDILPLQKVQSIVVRTREMAQIVNNIATKCGLVGFASFITIDPTLFL